MYHELSPLCKKIGKIPTEVNDYPGFVANRILMPMLNESIETLYYGVAGVKEIDTVMTRVGYRSKIIWCGDYRQTDLRKGNDKSGLLRFFDIAMHMSAFTRIEFTAADIVRSSLVKDYILAKLKYEDLEIDASHNKPT